MPTITAPSSNFPVRLRRSRSDDALDKRASIDALLAGLPTPLAPAEPSSEARGLQAPTSTAARLFNKVAASPAHVPKLTHELERLEQEVNNYTTWLAQFPEEERALAKVVAGALNIYSKERILQGCADLKKKILEVVPAGNRITYSYIHHAKSGALLSYHFRSANLVPDRDFDKAPFAEPATPDAKRTLVFLDDYVGTGFQFLQALSDIKLRHPMPFDQVVYATLVANPVAQKHLQAAHDGDYETLYQGGLYYIGDAAIARANADKFRSAGVDGVTLVTTEIETTLEERIAQTHGPEVAAQASALLSKYAHPSIRFGNLGRTAFEHNCPNTVPHMFWDSGVRDGQRTTPWHPLLERVHDRSIYAFTRGMEDKDVIFRHG